MGNYLSREEILGSTIQTRDVEAFGGIVCVREVDALTMQDMLEKGALVERPDGSSSVDLGKIDMIGMARKCIVDPDDPEKPILNRGDVEKLAKKGYVGILNVVVAAMEASGLDVEEDENAEKN